MAICGKSKIRGLVMAPALFALVAGISPMAQAQDEQSGLSAPTEGSRLAENHRGLASPIEGSWIFTIDVIGQSGTFNSLISFTAGGVVVTTASVPPLADSTEAGSRGSRIASTQPSMDSYRILLVKAWRCPK